MEQHDGPIVDAGDEFGEGLLRRGLVIHVPVHIGQAPEHGAVAQGLGLAQILLAVFSLRRAVEPGRVWPVVSWYSCSSSSSSC